MWEGNMGTEHGDEHGDRNMGNMGTDGTFSTTWNRPVSHFIHYCFDSLVL